jgi:hypothetical protein
MSIEVINGRIGDEEIVVLWYRNEGRSFGPRFEDAEEAEAFLEWLPAEAHRFAHDELVQHLASFRHQRETRLNSEHEASGGRFLLRNPSGRYNFFAGWSVDGPAIWEHIDEAQAFPTFAAADAMRGEWPTLRHCVIERAPR